MGSFTRSDIFVRDTNNQPLWLKEALDELANLSPKSIAANKQAKTVESVVKEYRDQVGLDLVAKDEVEELSKTAMIKTDRITLSIRQAQEEVVMEVEEDKPQHPVIKIIEGDEDLKRKIHQLLEHSGGHRETTSIIQYLRNAIDKGVELVSFSDEELKAYIDEQRKCHKSDQSDDKDFNVGKVGIDNDFNDSGAEYFTRGMGSK